MFAVVVPLHPQVDGAFHYRIPPQWAGQVQPGQLVTVSLAQREVQGVILRLDSAAPVAEVQPLLSIMDPQPALTPPQLAWLPRLAEATLTTMGALLPLFLPPGLAQHADVLYARTDAPLPPDLSATERQLARLLHERGPLRGRQIDRKMPRAIWQPVARKMVRRGWLTARSVLPPVRLKPKTVRTVQLAVTPARARAAMEEKLGRTEAAHRRRRAALDFLIREPEPVAVSWVYAASHCHAADLQALAARDLVILRETEIWRDPLERLPAAEEGTPPPQLTADQQAALDALLDGWREPSLRRQPVLLEGVTASGKTEVYLHLAAEVLRRGRSALILVPEIALTPQMVRRFMRRFPGQVGLIHSRLSAGERYDTWRRARAGLLPVIIGPRSALFTPLPDLGLIVLDECHEASYHQAEPPFYDARNVAETYARLLDAQLVLGSATPSVVQRFRAERGHYRHLRLPRRVTGNPSLPAVQLVDMRAELRQGNHGVFSRALQESLAETLLHGRQAILYLNRRGAATYVFCRDCGHALTCPHCETSLTWHVSDAALRCHRCNYHRRLPKTCPVCGSPHIRQYGLGTERVAQEVARAFPQARILRLDRDALRSQKAEMILHHFRNRQADVLIGTQMLTKGLDFPGVSLVGVVLAEVGLHFPDPFAGERVFQLLTQVAGRAGRSPAGGSVIFQTYHPEHYVLQAAAAQDVEAFYQRELKYRRRMGYPPFSRLLRLEFRHLDAAEAERRAAALAEQIRSWLEEAAQRETEIIGPAPAFFSRLQGRYRWQIVLRGPDPASLLRGRRLPGWRVEVDPVSLL